MFTYFIPVTCSVSSLNLSSDGFMSPGSNLFEVIRLVDSTPVSLTFDPLQRWSTSAPDASPRRCCSTCSVTRASTRKCTLTPTTVWARVTTCTHGTTRWTISSCCCRYEHLLLITVQFQSARRMFTDIIKDKSLKSKNWKDYYFLRQREIIRSSFNLERNITLK